MSLFSGEPLILTQDVGIWQYPKALRLEYRMRVSLSVLGYTRLCQQPSVYASAGLLRLGGVLGAAASL